MYYNELIQFTEQENFRSFVSGYTSDNLASEYVQGVQVGFDRFWLEDQLHKRLREGFPGSDLIMGSLTERSREARLFDQIHFDYDWIVSDNNYMRPRYWAEYCKGQGYPENSRPIFIKFLLRERPGQLSSFEPNNWQGYPLLYEYRPPCIGASILSKFSRTSQLAVGSGIRSEYIQEVGTAGGFLKNPLNGDAYLISCSHVVGPAGSEIAYHPKGKKGQPTRIGQVIYSTSLNPKQTNLPCNPQSVQPASTVDMGIVQLDNWVSISPDIPGIGNVNLVSPIAIMGQHQPIVLNGSTSGQVKGELGLLSFWCEIIIRGIPYCFNNLFSITPPHPYYLNSALVKGGDSGSWVVGSMPGMTSWDGMVIGCDGSQAFCCFADNIVNECAIRLLCIPKMA